MNSIAVNLVSVMSAKPKYSVHADLLALAKNHYKLDYRISNQYVAAVCIFAYHERSRSDRLAENFRNAFRVSKDLHSATIARLVTTVNEFALNEHDKIDSKTDTLLMRLASCDTGRSSLTESNRETPCVIGTHLLNTIMRMRCVPDLKIEVDENLQSLLTYTSQALANTTLLHDASDIYKLRRLLAIRSNLPLYTDDGELTTCDGSHIDFVNDTPQSISDKFVRLNTRLDTR